MLLRAAVWATRRQSELAARGGLWLAAWVPMYALSVFLLDWRILLDA